MIRTGLSLMMAALLLLGAGSLPALADEISDQIKRGLKLYEDGDLTGAVEELEFALAQMRQQKAENLTKIFPKAPSGWEAEKPKAQSAGRALLGGGINVTQVYKQGRGDGTVTMEVVTDSPFIQTLAMVLANPMIMQGDDHGRLIRLHGEKGLLKQVGKDGAELQILIDKRILFKVEVRQTDSADTVAKQFGELMDVKKLRDITK